LLTSTIKLLKKWKILKKVGYAPNVEKLMLLGNLHAGATVDIILSLTVLL